MMIRLVTSLAIVVGIFLVVFFLFFEDPETRKAAMTEKSMPAIDKKIQPSDSQKPSGPASTQAEKQEPRPAHVKKQKLSSPTSKTDYFEFLKIYLSQEEKETFKEYESCLSPDYSVIKCMKRYNPNPITSKEGFRLFLFQNIVVLKNLDIPRNLDIRLLEIIDELEDTLDVNPDHKGIKKMLTYYRCIFCGLLDDTASAGGYILNKNTKPCRFVLPRKDWCRDPSKIGGNMSDYFKSILDPLSNSNTKKED